MFKFIVLSCLLAASVQCKNAPSPAVPYYPQPYPAVYPQAYSAQPKYNVQPAYVAPAPYAPANYRQVFIAPANPAYNPYYYGYAPYPAYPQQYPYAYATNDGTQAPEAAAQPGWGEYLSNNIWNYVSNFPSLTESQSTPQSETQGATAAESTSNAEPAPVKEDKRPELQKTEQKPASDGQPAPTPLKLSAPSPFVYFGQPQFYGQLPYQAVYDPSKLNTANKGAVSSFLFYRNQPTIFQQPQPLADQKYYQIPVPQPYQGSAALAYQRYLQYQKQQQDGQYVPGQFQQEQFQQQQQDQPFKQQSEQFQQQQYDQNSQHDDTSVVVDSNSSGPQVNTENQQETQSKLATGSN